MIFRARRPFQITQNVVDSIAATVGSFPAERGGILGGYPRTGVVTHFHFDLSSRQTGATYSPNAQHLTELLQKHWNPRGIRLLGFVHSHPPSFRQLSTGDKVYAERILAVNDEMKELYLPLVMSAADSGCFELLPFGVTRSGERKVTVEAMKLMVTASVSNGVFERVSEAYDLEWLKRCRVIAVGAGGANQWLNSLARTGVGEIVVVDPDKVELKNIGTQHVYLSDVGQYKVQVVASRLRDINAEARVWPIPASLEEIDDETFARLAMAPWDQIEDREWRLHAAEDRSGPRRTLLCGLTDNFEAQARVNRLALQFGIPSLSAQVYREGRAAEITFTMPGVTPACQRCALRNRYEHFLQRGFKNNVTSNGTPIWSTDRLNALKGEIAMAILHHGTGHSRYGHLLDRIGNRNLIQVRMDPDLAETLGLTVFDRTFAGADRTRLLTDEAVWLPQEPDRPENNYPRCPDCGGTGDLRRAIGRFQDTRVMPLKWEAEA
jgi:hypothetical protein